MAEPSPPPPPPDAFPPPSSSSDGGSGSSGTSGRSVVASFFLTLLLILIILGAMFGVWLMFKATPHQKEVVRERARVVVEWIRNAVDDTWAWIR